MAFAQVSASPSLSVRDVCAVASPKSAHVVPSRVTSSNIALVRTVFATGSPLVIPRSLKARKSARVAASSAPIRCEQSTQSSLDIWLGRLAMVGFAVALSVEIATGKGLLENFGLTTPLPTVALAVTALVGVLTAIFIFQSASRK
ncbi:stress enhanced protein 1, chloroplastic [Punica granatum]|uniref:Uncharacterized protein n=2 Tax=Punica granatum TaxID=22663 RepID=A0A2I0JQS8_PUNGR|nr:stress enhanced protein 1, chloroplastic [Punica granatum]PKI58642.1 hypothetical protein CRG98_020968 [Punica granatum]